MRDDLYASFSPGQNAPCLCGSGLKFKRCCGPKLNEDLAVRAGNDAFSAGRYKEALILCRRYFSRYLIWHRAHTVPLVERGIKTGDEIMSVDIDALSEMLDLQRECYVKIEREAEFGVVLMRLAPAVDDPRWSQKILYQRALLALHSRSTKSAQQVLNEISSSDHIQDFELLTLYWDLMREKLPVSQQIHLVHQLVSGARTREERLQYGLLKGHFYRLVGDDSEGLRLIRETINATDLGRDADYSVRERHLLAASLLFLAPSENSKENVQRARNLILDELASDHLTNAGKGLFQSVLGDTYAAEGRFANAAECFRASLAFEEQPAARFSLARSLVRMNDLDAAEKVLAAMDYDKLSVPLQYDHSTIYAELAYLSGKPELISVATQRLSNLRPAYPLQRDLKDHLLTMLGKCDRPNSESTLARWRRQLSKYLILQPTVLGFGININNLLHDPESKKDRTQ